MDQPLASNPPAPRGAWAPWLALMGAFALLVGPMIAVELTRPPVPPITDKPAALGYPSELLDQEWYHLGVIETMAGQWPAVDVVSYDSATTPGYHVVQATVQRLTGAWWPVQIVNALMGAAFVTVVYTTLLGVLGRGWPAAALTAPLVASPYTVGGSIWLTTDNLCWAFVVLAVGGAALRPFTPARGVRLGVYAMAAMLVRQIHIWPIAVVGLAAALASPLAGLAPRFLRSDGPRSWLSLGVGVAAAGVPAAILALFIWLWGGLLPDSERIRILHVDGANPAAPAFALAVIASAAVFLLPLVWREAVRTRPWDPVVLGAGLIGLIAALAPATSYLQHPRSGGWVWQLVARLPAPMDRSILIAVAAPAGAVALVVLTRAAARAGRLAPAALMLLALLAWLSAQTVSTMAWQRYFDPMILFTLATITALGVPRDTPRLAWLAPLALAVFQALLSVATLHAPFVRKVMEVSGG